MALLVVAIAILAWHWPAAALIVAAVIVEEWLMQERDKQIVLTHLATVRARMHYIDWFVQQQDWGSARNNATWLISTLHVLEGMFIDLHRQHMGESSI